MVWIQAKCEGNGSPSTVILNLIHFRNYVADALILCNAESRKTGRLSNGSSPIPKNVDTKKLDI